MKQRLLRFGGWVLWGLVVFLFALRLHFPKGEIIEGLPFMVEEASGGDWALDIGDAGLYWLPNGASVDDVTLYSVERPTTRRRGRGRANRDQENEDDTDATADGPSLRPFIDIDHGEASVSLLSLLFGDALDINYAVELHEGRVSGTYSQASDFYNLDWESTPLDIAELPLSLPGIFSIEGAGNFVTNGTLKRFPNQVQKDTGTFSFSFPGLIAERLTFDLSGIEAYVEDAIFSEAVISGKIENGRIEIEEGNLISDKLELTLQGRMTMNNRELDTWRVRFELSLKAIDEGFQSILDMGGPAVRAAQAEDGTLYLVCSGNWGSMNCNPDRTMVEGPEPRTNTSRSSTRNSSTNRSSTSRSRTDRERDEVEDADDDGDRSAAEERRRERLDDIRARREERTRMREEEREAEERGEIFDEMDVMDDHQNDMMLPDDFPDRLPEDEFDDEEYFIEDMGPDDGGDY